MNGTWKEVACLRFQGERFRDHALDLTALTELSQFQKLVAETAKELWRAENPDKKNLPKRFEDRTRLCLREIRDGSAVAPLEVYLEGGEQTDLLETPTEVERAVSLTYDVFDALDKGRQFPDTFPRNLIPEYVKLGKNLEPGHSIEFSSNGKPPARVSPQMREKWEIYHDEPYEDIVDLAGEVLEVDIHKGKFQLWLDDGSTKVDAQFNEQQEEDVTTALKEHRSLRLRVTGRGEFNALGKPLRVTEVDHLAISSAEEEEFDATARPIEDILAELASEVPEEEWDSLPKDLNENLDHYLYGTPKG
jgi:hypothetical protein